MENIRLKRLKDKYTHLNYLLDSVNELPCRGVVEMALRSLLKIEIKETADELWQTYRVRV